ncbi:unnamed protein product, partial [Polarella glacialis]
MAGVYSGASAPFDYCVVTASTPGQASLYKELVQRRVASGLYPSDLKFRFYSDPFGGRVGSGGGTLVALHELFQEEVGRPAIDSETGALDEDGVREFFGHRRVLLLHAGGESRRLPCYVPEGKLFGPLALGHRSPTESCPAVVLDLLLSLYFKYPWAKGEVVLASGDVIVDFDAPTQLFGPEGLAPRGAICGFGKLAPLEQGSRHGVFAFGGSTPDE